MSEIKFEFLEEDGERVQCDSCGYRAPLAPFEWAPGVAPHEKRRPYRFLCEVCSTTYISRITEYHAGDDMHFLRREIAELIAQATNHILSKLGRL